MKEIDFGLTRDWCSQHGYQTAGPARFSLPASAQLYADSVALPVNHDGRMEVWHRVFEAVGPRFAGAIVRLVGWGAGEEYVSPRLHEQLRKSYGVPAVGGDGTALLFEPHEREDALALFGFYVAVSWDAYYLPADGRCIVFTSNDGFLDFKAADDTVRRGLLACLEPWDVKPDPSSWYFRPENGPQKA